MDILATLILCFRTDIFAIIKLTTRSLNFRTNGFVDFFAAKLTVLMFSNFILLGVVYVEL